MERVVEMAEGISEGLTTILIVEDNLALLKEEKKYFSTHGYLVYEATGRTDALRFLKEKKIDICLLDISLRDCSGIDLCLEMREIYLNPIIFLTAYDEEDKVVDALHNGGDDYVTKPFSFVVLKSRIEAQLRRCRGLSKKDKKEYISGELRFDLVAMKVYRGAEEIELTRMEIEICRILLFYAGQLVTREDLLQSLWDGKGEYVEDNTLSVLCGRVRKKIGAYKEDEYIETIRGYGYRWNVEVKP